MAVLLERGERVKFVDLFTRVRVRKVTSGINWTVFLSCWVLVYGRYLISIRTPWFQVMISSGNRDYMSYCRWYGVRLSWNHPKGWLIDEGGILFTKSDDSLSFTKPEMQRVW